MITLLIILAIYLVGIVVAIALDAYCDAKEKCKGEASCLHLLSWFWALLIVYDQFNVPNLFEILYNWFYDKFKKD